MGLDNGIILKNPKLKQIPPYVKPRFEGNTEYFDVCYWRKCWGIRRIFLRVLDPEHKYENSCKIPIDAEDIPALQRALKPFFDKKYWEENAESIWEYEDYLNVLLQDWVSLCWLENYLKNNLDSECYFYDSY